YREDSNEAALVVVVVDEIYAHESLTFNDIVSCEVISKWKARLKEYMDVWSDVYVLNNGCKKSSDDNHDYYWKFAPVQDSQRNLVRTLLKGHSILSLEDSLSGDCDVEKNGLEEGNMAKGALDSVKI
nr:zinc finger, CCHC-type [Tanacetum cinerariifolium]